MKIYLQLPSSILTSNFLAVVDISASVTVNPASLTILTMGSNCSICAGVSCLGSQFGKSKVMLPSSLFLLAKRVPLKVSNSRQSEEFSA